MQELRLVAVSEDGSYLVLATAGRGTRFTLPVDDRLRAAVRGHFSRLGQFEIEVESPLRPKEIQARIRAGETADEIAESAGIPVERVRWFEGPVLQEREYMAQQAQRVAVRRPGETTPGAPLGEMVEERLGRRGIDIEDVEWDSWKCEDSTWRVRLSFFEDGRPYTAEWGFDPRRRHVSPHDEEAAQLCSLVLEEPATDTVTPLMPRRPAMKVVPDSLGVPSEPRHDRVRREYIVERGRMVSQPEPVARPEPPAPAEPAGPQFERQEFERQEFDRQEFDRHEFVEVTEAEERHRHAAEPPRRMEPRSERAPERHAQPASGESEPREPTAREAAASARTDSSRTEPVSPRTEPASPRTDSSRTDSSRTDSSRTDSSRTEPAPPRTEPVSPRDEPAARRRARADESEPADVSPADLTEPKTPAPRPAARREPEPARKPAEPRPKKAADHRKDEAPSREETAETPATPADAGKRSAADETEGGRAPKPAAKPERPRRREPVEPAPDQVAAAQVKEPAAVTGDKPVSAPSNPPPRPRRKSARGKRASVPSWDEIMFGARRPD